MASLRARVEGARRERIALERHARMMERTRIAREMHDVLAHRISLLALQAGALEHSEALATREDRKLVRGIADASRRVLQELRDILGVLRAGTDPGGDTPDDAMLTVPSLADVPELVAGARRSGLDVALSVAVSGEPSEAVARTCYRVVQEGLTNAAKHAPTAPVEVLIEDGAELPDGVVRVRVRTGPSCGGATSAALPASGFGLTGLSERVELLGGSLEHGATSDGGHLLTVRLPGPGSVPDRGA